MGLELLLSASDLVPKSGHVQDPLESPRPGAQHTPKGRLDNLHLWQTPRMN